MGISEIVQNGLGFNVPKRELVSAVQATWLARRRKKTPVRVRRNEVKRHWQKAFLAALEQTGSVTEAAQAAKVGRWNVYDAKRNDANFSKEWDEALDRAADMLEDEARKRAFAGSDVLLMFLLKGIRPQKWRESRASIPPAELNKMIEVELERIAKQKEAETMSESVN